MSGRPPADSEVAGFEATLTNPYQLDETAGSEADGMRIDSSTWRMRPRSRTFGPICGPNHECILKTPYVMLCGLGR